MYKRVLTLSIAITLLFTGVAINTWRADAQDGGTPLAALPATAPYQPNAEELNTAALYNRVTQAIVNVAVATQTGGGTGSGFVIDGRGHIVTNNHVVEDAAYIEVTFVDGLILPALLVGRDPDADLAVIKVDPSAVALQPIQFADSDQVFVGQGVFAIGSPFGQDFTLTSGIVSGLDRSLRNADAFSIPELIQTDTAINPGNSGGPLLNWEGHVVGVNTAILSDSNSNSGVGFAIPSNTVRRIVPYLINQGYYDHAWLGIGIGDLYPAQREAMGLSATQRGVIVTDVVQNGPAARAGLSGATGMINTPMGSRVVNGDIITAVNEQPIDTMNDLIAYLETQTLPGDVIMLTVLRAGNTLQLAVTLQPRP
ncbi:MAG: trypsin-like peptidase domain-containing protein [Anaerolineae bacterium]|nr:trypsin-like peptidase domain-containing protein [Anaerolineae bacterium]